MEFKECHQGITTVSLKPINCNCANDEVIFHLKNFSIMKLTASVKASVSNCIVYVFSSKSNWANTEKCYVTCYQIRLGCFCSESLKKGTKQLNQSQSSLF